MIELHVAIHVGGLGRGLLRLKLGLLQEGEDALGGRGHLLQHVAHLRKLRDGLREVLHVLDERLDVADGDDALHGQHAAGQRHAHIAQVAHEVHDGLHQARQELRFPSAFIEFRIGLAERLGNRLLAIERAHDGMAGKRFLNLAVDGAEHGLLGPEVLLRGLHHGEDERQGHGQDEHGDAREQRVDSQHHDHHAHDGGGRGDELRHALVQALAERVHVVGDARERVAG